MAIILAIGTITFYPFLNPRQALFGTNKGHEELILTKFDLFNPTYTVVINHRKDGDTGERAISIVKLKRDSLFTFKVGEILAGGKSQNATFDEVKKYIQNNNLVEKNPNPDVFIGVFGREEDYTDDDIFFGEKDDSYYLDIKVTNSGGKLSPNNFENLKVGDSLIQLKSQVGNSDRIMISGLFTKKYERNYKINNQEFSFISVVFDKDADEISDAKIEKILLIKHNREYLEIPIAADGSFNFSGI